VISYGSWAKLSAKLCHGDLSDSSRYLPVDLHLIRETNYFPMPARSDLLAIALGNVVAARA
jgi:hypothetical protein